MRRDFVPEDRTPDPDLPRHARDYYPGTTAPPGLGQRTADWVPESGRAPAPAPEEDASAPLNVPKEAPLLENDFVPNVPESPPERLPIGFVVDQTEDGNLLVVAGYDKKGRMLVREQTADDAVEEARGERREAREGEEAGTKGGETGLLDARGEPLLPAEDTDPKPAPKSHKKKKDEPA